MNILELLNYGSQKLKIKEISSHILDAEILLSRVLKKRREEVLLNIHKNVSSDQINEFNNLISRRSLKEPIAYILKEKEFWSKKFEVGTGILIPRPETELMVEKIIKLYNKKSAFILDVGTGSGCILISLLSELKKSSGIGIDISQKALSYALKNSKRHNLQNRIKFLKISINMFFNRKFDLIVSNPPYVIRGNLKNLDEGIKNYEPMMALDGGNDGLDVIRKVIYKAKEILKFNGLLSLEIGNGQYRKVSELLTKNRFILKHNIRDYKTNTRCIISSLSI